MKHTHNHLLTTPTTTSSPDLCDNTLVCSNLSVHLRGQLVLRNIDLTCPPGSITAILGPSGSGKSTLLKTIAGLTPPSSGSIDLLPKHITELPAHKRKIALVFQDLRLFPHLNVAENIAYPLRIQKIPVHERNRIVDDLLEQVQLSHVGQKRIGELSGGQAQRVALARALASNPSILLLDEPFSALDATLRNDMAELLLNINRAQKISMVLVTHDQNEAFRLADRVAILLQGSIEQIDTPHAIIDKPASLNVAQYLGNGHLLSAEDPALPSSFKERVPSQCILWVRSCDIQYDPSATQYLYPRHAYCTADGTMLLEAQDEKNRIWNIDMRQMEIDDLSAPIPYRINPQESYMFNSTQG